MFFTYNNLNILKLKFQKNVKLHQSILRNDGFDGLTKGKEFWLIFS